MNPFRGASRILSAMFIIFTLLLTSQAHGQGTSVTGNENFTISFATASTLVKNYQASAPTGTPWGFYYGKVALQSVLAQADCVGVRIYFGKQADGTPCLVIVGVNSKNQDMTGGTLLEMGYPCPPICDTTTVLGH